ncbi:glycosyltransferase [Streptomyces pyxinae]|uniref:glycosyltransferase n=1 Tax=Streptomyces pyxinae TaxID=2970734 RepID=UPI003D170498
MRVLHVITGLGIGGAEQQLRALLRQLPTQHRVVTLTNPGPVADGLRADGVPVAHLAMGGNRDLTALPRLTRLIRAGGYDLVHTHLYRACLYGRIAARLAGVRTVVATEHSLGAAQIEGRPLTPGTRALYLAGERLGTATVAVSEAVARRLTDWGVAPERVRVVPNGIEPARFAHDPAARRAVRARLGLPPGAYVIGGVGRLVPGKRFDALVRAFAAVAAERPGIRLLLIGDGPERARLERLAAERGVADRVVWTGGVPQDRETAPPGRGTTTVLGGAPAPDGPGAAPTRVTAGLGGPLAPVPVRPEAPAPDGPGTAPVPAGREALGPVPAGPGAAPARAPVPSGPGGAPGLPGLPGPLGLPGLLAAMDLFVSASPDEAFGLAVVEALAAGLPVRYVACPALEDLPPGDAPGARRTGPTVPELAAALREAAGAGPVRLPVPAAVRHYDIARSARRLLSLYEACHERAGHPARHARPAHLIHQAHRTHRSHHDPSRSE